MNFMRAVGFLTVGAVLGYLPRWAPGLCAATGVDGASTRAIWLHLMATLLIGIAASYFLRSAGNVLGKLMRYESKPLGETLRLQPAYGWRRSRFAQQRLMGSRLHPSRALPLPAAFKGGLLEQRRAA